MLKPDNFFEDLRKANDAADKALAEKLKKSKPKAKKSKKKTSKK